ncbi:hypothetical protein FRC12_006327 [Ceratobasidium sp. 428]|nr:hypothetical protein FRC12_006327 [Ceratobasidium sp. 428]
MSPNQNVFQQIFEISEIANLLGDHTHDTDQTKIRREIAERTMKKLGDATATSKWTVAWGPAEWQDGTSAQAAAADDISANFISTNALFIASGSMITFPDGIAYTTCVVGIGAAAGINGLQSFSDIGSVINLDEWASKGIDGLSNPPSTYTPKSPSDVDGSAYIANGFGQALFRIINLKNPVAPHYQETILQSLQRVAAQPNTKVVITGHSVGGALAYSLAYVLAKAGLFGSSPSQRVHVYPTGAPSIGNRTFVDSFRTCFPPPEGSSREGYQHWNVNIVNPFDIVPYAYCTLEEIRSIYGTEGELTGVKDLVESLNKTAENVPYYPFESSEFKSPIPKPPMAPGSYAGFLLCAGQQHISAYKAHIFSPNAEPRSHDAGRVE